MIRRNTRRSLTLVLLAALLLSLGACGGDGPQRSSSSFVMAVPAIPSSLDPADFQSDTSNNTFFVWASLLTLYPKLEPGDTTLQGPNEVVGDLAKSWKAAPEGYVVTLRNVSSPYGNKLTSQDVKWSFERAMAIDQIAQYQLSLGSVDAKNPIEVLDAKHFLLRASDQLAPTFAILDWYGESILDSQTVMKHATNADPWAREWLKLHTAGYGPYHVKEFRPGVSIKLTRNPGYWRHIQYESVIMQAVPEASNRIQLVDSGRATFAHGVSYDQAALLKNSKNGRLIEALEANTDQMTLNLKYAPFKEPKVRQALSLALDREALVQGPYHGYGKPAGMINSTIPQPDLGHGPLTQNVSAAKALLQEAGYPNGFKFTLSVNADRPGPYASNLAVEIGSQLKAIGVQMKINVVASLADFAAGWDGKFDAWIDKGAAPIIDVGAWASNAVKSDGVNNKGGYSSAQVDDIVTRLRNTSDGPERDDLIKDLDQALGQDVPYIPLVETVRLVALNRNVDGYSTDPIRQLYPSRLFPASD